MYSSITIANHFLRESWKAGTRDITPMKLLKLVYIAHGWFLGDTGNRLIYDPVCAWPYGPVIPNLYFRINHYRGYPITSEITSEIGFSNEPELCDSVIKFLDIILKHYNQYSAFELSALTHQKDTPWYKVKKTSSQKKLDSRSVLIPDDVIKAYYAEKIEAVKRQQ